MKILTLKPPLLKKLDRLTNKVKVLTYLGVDPNSIISGPVVAIVGTRKPTPYGKQVTELLASELSRAGVVVVSGLAFGVDIIAHKAVLDAGGKTIAVIASGLKNIYPASHQKIAEKITKQGSTISEYPENHMPRKVEFLERNRIIAGLSDLVIIPEAAERSGSLNTAKHAESMGIPVCAVPGPINSPLSAGSNWLIQQGANLITSSDDVLKLLNMDKSANRQISLLGSNDQETAILQIIADGINDPQLIQLAINISTADLQISLTMLEIAGRIEQNSLGAWHIR